MPTNKRQPPHFPEEGSTLNTRRSFRSSVICSLVVGLLVLPLGPAALAKRSSKPAVTDLRLRLESHDVMLGEEVTGTVSARSRNKGKTTALAGATVNIYVGRTLVEQVVTDEAGTAAVSYTTAAIGSYSLKAVYAGDSTHKRAKRAQGFEVMTTFYADADGDGYGSPDAAVVASEQPDGSVENGTDCDDVSAAVNPGTAEVVGNMIDDNCDGLAD